LKQTGIGQALGLHSYRKISPEQAVWDRKPPERYPQLIAEKAARNNGPKDRICTVRKNCPGVWHDRLRGEDYFWFLSNGTKVQARPAFLSTLLDGALRKTQAGYALAYLPIKS
jgi:hypothetical protein